MGFRLNDPVLWIIISAIALVVITIVLTAILVARANHRKPRGKRAAKVKVRGGVRYSKSNIIEDGAGIQVTHNQGDISLARGQTYTARKGGKKDNTLMPGKYTLLTSAKGEEKVNVRIGRLMREYTHGDGIVLPEGETITPTSHSIVLR